VKPQYRVNREIQAPRVRVIGEDGRQIGIMSLQEALKLAYEKDLDLVEVAPDSDPPVCKLMDYEKFIYEKIRRERESRKARKGGEVKEIRLRPSISEHDLSYRLQDIRDFLQEGNKVKLRVVFKGREIDHPEMALKLLEKIMAGLSDIARIDQKPQSDGRSLVMILASK